MKKIAVILAGGRGSRMEGTTSKPLTLLNDKTLIEYSIDACKNLVDDILIVYSDYSSDLLDSYPNYLFAKQDVPNGAGKALQAAMPKIKDYDSCLVLACDMPLIKEETLKKFINDFEEKELTCSYLVTTLEDSTNYGRVVVDGKLIKIVEQADVDETNKDILVVNTATYLFDINTLPKYINLLSIENKKKEYLITDLIYHFSSNGELCGVFHEDDKDQFIGVNSLKELNQAEKLI